MMIRFTSTWVQTLNSDDSKNDIYQLYESLTGFTNIPTYGFATTQYSSIYIYKYLHSTKAWKSVLNSTRLCQWCKSAHHCLWRKSAFITCVSDVSVTSNTCAIQYSVHNRPRLGTPGHGSAVQKTQDTFISALGYSIRHTDYHGKKLVYLWSSSPAQWHKSLSVLLLFT
jgi:hypothetical protein